MFIETLFIVQKLRNILIPNRELFLKVNAFIDTMEYYVALKLYCK